MKLYNKKLSSLKELEVERRKLKAELRQIEAEGLISTEELLDGLKGGAVGIGAMLTHIPPSILSFLPPVASRLFSMVRSRFSRTHKSSDPEAEYADRHEHKDGLLKGMAKKGGETLLSAGKEVLGSYLKWKVLELSYKGLSLVVRKQKKKKAARKAAMDAIAEYEERHPAHK